MEDPDKLSGGGYEGAIDLSRHLGPSKPGRIKGGRAGNGDIGFRAKTSFPTRINVTVGIRMPNRNIPRQQLLLRQQPGILKRLKVW